MDENTYYVQGEMGLPREKIQKLGPKSLSNEELLTLIRADAPFFEQAFNYRV